MSRVTVFLAAFFGLLLPLPSGARQTAPEEKVVLRWKIPADKPVGFKTCMRTIDASKDASIQIDWKAMNEALQEVGKRTDTKVPEVPPEKFEKILSLPREFSLTTILQLTPGKNISAKMIMNDLPPLKEDASETQKMFQKMAGRVQIRGEIDEAGRIESFYLQSKQKNLLALFFELPKDPVKVGDTWPLQVNMVSVGEGFICKKAERTNRVRLQNLKRLAGGEQVATLDYIVTEGIEGDFKMPMSDKTQPTTMYIGFLGRGEFSVTQGRWQKYVGRMKTKSTGLMTSDSEQELAMEPLPEIPEKLLKSE